MTLAVVIAAGGVGSRMGRAKQLMELAGQPVLARTAQIFQDHDAVSEIVIAIDEDKISECRQMVESFGLTKVSGIVAGGDSRAASVKNGLAALSETVELVAVHDGARPLFPGGLLSGALDLLSGGKPDSATSHPGLAPLDGVVFGVAVTDTIKQTEAATDLITGTPDRRLLWAAQTPQIFRRKKIEKAYTTDESRIREATDDSFLVEMAGGRVKMIMGSRENIKLTEPLDVLVAEEILRGRASAHEPQENGKTGSERNSAQTQPPTP